MLVVLSAFYGASVYATTMMMMVMMTSATQTVYDSTHESYVAIASVSRVFAGYCSSTGCHCSPTSTRADG